LGLEAIKAAHSLPGTILGRTFTEKVKKVIQPHYRPEVPRGFQEVKVPRLRDNGPGWW